MTPITVPVLQRIGSGDSAAVQECIRTYGGLVWSLALRMCAGRADAEDAVHEIFMDLWRHAAAFDADGRPEWLYVAVLARRRLIERWHGCSRRLETEPPEDVEQTREPRSPTTSAADLELSGARQAIRALNPEQRLLITLGVVQGMTHGEIARHTGKSPATVKTQMRRGLVRLREGTGGGVQRAGKVTA